MIIEGAVVVRQKSRTDHVTNASRELELARERLCRWLKSSGQEADGRLPLCYKLAERERVVVRVNTA